MCLHVIRFGSKLCIMKEKLKLFKTLVFLLLCHIWTETVKVYRQKTTQNYPKTMKKRTCCNDIFYRFFQFYLRINLFPKFNKGKFL